MPDSLAAEPLDPAIAELASAAVAVGAAPLHEIGPAEARARVSAGDRLCAAGPDLAAVDDVPVGDILVRVYRSRIPGSGRTLVWCHGGGWVTGDLEYSDELCRFLARDADATVVSVGYRLAPEHPFPCALEDVRSAIAWARSSVGGVVAVGGDSAGGALAAACARGTAFQVLVYPVTDHDFTRPSYVAQASGFPIGAAAMRWFWDHYVPDPARRHAASPLRAADLPGLPPAVVVVAGHDPLHDEGVAYARNLRRAGVAVTLLDYPSLVHGFFRLTGAVAAAREATTELTDTVRRLFDPRRDTDQ
jgi:acetyl esterase